ncbi:TetR/AcrR family transcriptional regulator [Microbacterium sp. LRZ72]|uniref:TetR/AcrR family transcriptional regulator n=1 Tax=Microbacterium sp. LRZ72 TaxID=2942481 RepID=UPI0029A2D4CB|nr:helix-turn-helix domain-containing protein [Microbacterium sp. LRZ72]MDX2376018.1 TetR/AcrR family transcriptional regulator [Microbacterium sp. LRZ72]
MGDESTTPSRRREITRNRLLDAAAQVFAEVGLDAASVETVCERAGFTRGAFYSNFASKEEMFLELAGRVAAERVGVVKARIAELERQGAFQTVPTDALAMVEQIIDISNEDRLGVLLMNEIRIHALRSPALAAAYVAQEVQMRAGVAQIIEDIAAAKGITFRVPADEAAALMLMAWESASVHAVMSGADKAQMTSLTSERLAAVARLIIDSPQS